MLEKYYYAKIQIIKSPHSVGILAGTDGTGENGHLNRMNNLVGCLKNVSDDDDVVFDLSIEIFMAGMT